MNQKPKKTNKNEELFNGLGRTVKPVEQPISALVPAKGVPKRHNKHNKNVYVSNEDMIQIQAIRLLAATKGLKVSDSIIMRASLHVVKKEIELVAEMEKLVEQDCRLVKNKEEMK